MTIREVLEDCHVLDNKVDIQLRYFDIDNHDLFGGYADYEEGKMIDDEGYHYNLDMPVEDYEFEFAPLHYNQMLLTLWFGCDFGYDFEE